MRTASGSCGANVGAAHRSLPTARVCRGAAEFAIRRRARGEQKFLERSRSAVDVFTMGARAEELPMYVQRFHRAERDMLGVDRTEIERSAWV